MTYAILVGVLVFGDMPDPLTLSGAAVIFASGLYVLRSETQAARPAPPLAAQAEILS